ncbi:MAG: ankyrin repeat domain-containing protein [Cytophagales bacterium]|nr:ankyrin repeat domain-containing protein [Cytophagales bacterium]
MKKVKILLVLILTISCAKRKTAFSLSKMLEVSVYNTEEFTQALEQGDLSKVQRMVEENTIDVNRKIPYNNSLFTPLQIVASWGHLPVVEYLLNRGANVNEKTEGSQRTPLHLAAGMNHVSVVKLLLEREADIEAKTTGDETALDLARKKGYQGVIKIIESHKRKLKLRQALGDDEFERIKSTLEQADYRANNLVNDQGHNLLYTAAQEKWEKVVKFLVETEEEDKLMAAIHANNDYKHAPLYIAVQNGNFELVRLLIYGRAMKDNRMKENAEEEIAYGAVKAMIGVVRNLQDQDQRTLLHWAAMKDALEILQLLTEFVAIAAEKSELSKLKEGLLLYKDIMQEVDFVNKKDKDGHTALDLAVNDEVREYLKRIKKIDESEWDRKVSESSSQNCRLDEAKIKVISSYRSAWKHSLALQDEYSRSAGVRVFVAAVKTGQAALVDKLLDKGMSLREKDEYGRSAGYRALSDAAKAGQAALVDKLLSLDVSLQEKDYEGRSAGYRALWAAVEGGQAALVDKLLSLGVSLQEKDYEGRSAGVKALVVAAKAGQAALVDKLLGKISLQEKDEYGGCSAGYRALSDAVEAGQVALVDKLLLRGVSLQEKDNWGRSAGARALWAAARGGQAALVDKLLLRGVSLQEKDNRGRSAGYKALWAAAKAGQAALVDKLLLRGVSLQEKDNWGCSAGYRALWAAAEAGQAALVDKLLSLGVEPTGKR